MVHFENKGSTSVIFIRKVLYNEIVNRETLKAFIQFLWFIYDYEESGLKDLTQVGLFKL